MSYDADFFCLHYLERKQIRAVVKNTCIKHTAVSVYFIHLLL